MASIDDAAEALKKTVSTQCWRITLDAREWENHVPDNLDDELVDTLWFRTIVAAGELSYAVQTWDAFGDRDMNGVVRFWEHDIYVRPRHPFSMLSTLFHELAHVVLYNEAHELGVSYPPDLLWDAPLREVVCDATAAILLQTLGVTNDVRENVSYILYCYHKKSAKAMKYHEKRIKRYVASILKLLDEAAAFVLQLNQEELNALLASS